MEVKKKVPLVGVRTIYHSNH